MEKELTMIKSLLEHKTVISDIVGNLKLQNQICKVGVELINCFKNQNKVLLCGNGGSAADAQHIAAELSGRFMFDRAPLDAEALHVNTSYLTAVGNDYGYEHVFSRLVEARGKKGDVLIGLSTSGNSLNVNKALLRAKEKEMITIGFTGKSQNDMEKYSDFLISIPSSSTARIQEGHILVGHIICEMVENGLFGENNEI